MAIEKVLPLDCYGEFMHPRQDLNQIETCYKINGTYYDKRIRALLDQYNHKIVEIRHDSTTDENLYTIHIILIFETEADLALFSLNFENFLNELLVIGKQYTTFRLFHRGQNYDYVTIDKLLDLNWIMEEYKHDTYYTNYRAVECIPNADFNIFQS